MIIGIGVMNPFDNEENEKNEAPCEKCCANEDNTPLPKLSDEGLQSLGELISKFLPDEDKPILAVPDKAREVVEATKAVIHTIMEADGMDKKRVTASIGMKALNNALSCLESALAEMEKAAKEEKPHA